MARKLTKVANLTGWKHVRAAYQSLTSKLNEAGATTAQKKAAIAYWQARLAEDLVEINNERPPCEGFKDEEA